MVVCYVNSAYEFENKVLELEIFNFENKPLGKN